MTADDVVRIWAINARARLEAEGCSEVEIADLIARGRALAAGVEPERLDQLLALTAEGTAMIPPSPLTDRQRELLALDALGRDVLASRGGRS